MDNKRRLSTFWHYFIDCINALYSSKHPPTTFLHYRVSRTANTGIWFYVSAVFKLGAGFYTKRSTFAVGRAEMAFETSFLTFRLQLRCAFFCDTFCILWLILLFILLFSKEKVKLAFLWRVCIASAHPPNPISHKTFVLLAALRFKKIS